MFKANSFNLPRDVIVRSPLALHRGSPNRTNQPRPMVVMGYVMHWLHTPKVDLTVPHDYPFCDEDGQWYLFYARDFLDTEGGVRVGTALFVDRLLTMTKLAGEGKVVLRSRCDWQRFLSDRLMYGEIYDWHTLEGPCVRKHEGKYYCFYSGGRWETENYGVDYGIAENIMGPYSDAGNETGPRVLKSVPNFVKGPGHNSIVIGPDGHTEYLVYHAWTHNMDKRQICLDKLIWTPEGPRCQGPTWTPQTITKS